MPSSARTLVDVKFHLRTFETVTVLSLHFITTMPPCSTTNCTYASSPASDVVPGSRHALNPEVVAIICFGLVMCLLALLALWQGRQQLRRTAIKSRQKFCWPRPFNTTARGAIGQAPLSGSDIISNTYVNGRLSSGADGIERLLMTIVVFAGHFESQNRTTPPMSLPPIATDPSDAYMQLPAPPAPVHVRHISPTPPTTSMNLSKHHSSKAIPANPRGPR